MGPDPLADLTHLASIPQHWARVTPRAPALWEHDRVVSYRELDHGIAAARALLRAHGVGPGDRVAIVGENSLALVALLFGALGLDAWPLPLNARMAPREIDGLLALAGARVVCFTSAVSAAAQAHGQRLGARRWEPVGLWPAGDPGVLVAVAPHPVHRPEPDAQGVALLLATSGSSGAPKAVMLTHAALLHFCRVSRSARALRPHDVAYAVLPMSHIFGLGTLLMVTLYGGASLYLAPRFEPEGLLQATRKHGLSMLFGVPAMYTRLLEHLREAGDGELAGHDLRYAYVGAAALELPLKREFEGRFGCRMHHGWGMTEYAGSMAITRVDQDRDDTAVGHANKGCELRLVGLDGTPVSAGGVGEVWIRGPGLMAGYYREPDLTAQALRPDGWFATGDLGRFADDGALFIVGRSKEMIIRSGFNVYPAEVEAALHAHPAVRLAAVLGRREPSGNESVFACIEPAPGASLDLDELRAHLRECLAPYKQPAEIEVYEALPLLANGKIDKRKLRERHAG
jgi:acyl-CoA synthetase (AMP-forming)/AMP-acid ligase II